MSENYWKTCGSYSDIKYVKSEEGIAKITINRPEVRNAFRPLTVREMRSALEDSREDTDIGVIILTEKVIRPSAPEVISACGENLDIRTMKRVIQDLMF